MTFQAISNQEQPLRHWVWLPDVGLVLIVFSVLFWYRQRYEVSFGPKAVWIPLLIIAISIAISSLLRVGDLGLSKVFGYAIWGFLLFGIYGIARSVGAKIFTPLVYGMLFAIVGMVYYAFVHTGQIGNTGGWVSPSNYNIAGWMLCFGLMVSSFQKRWWIAVPVLFAIMLTGDEEGYFAVFCVVVLMVIRKDFDRRVFIVLGCIGAFLLILGASGYFQQAFFRVLDAFHIDLGQQPDFYRSRADPNLWIPATGMNGILHGRAEVWTRSLHHISVFGHGYEISNFSTATIHNVPLIVMAQIGPIAALVWIWTTVWCLIKTQWKYAFVVVLAMSLFDHLVWTEACYWWWVLVGVASASTVETDLIFRKIQHENA